MLYARLSGQGLFSRATEHAQNFPLLRLCMSCHPRARLNRSTLRADERDIAHSTVQRYCTKRRTVSARSSIPIPRPGFAGVQYKVYHPSDVDVDWVH